MAVGRQGVNQDAAADGPVRSYGRVLVVWVLVLIALYVFQEYFN